MPSTPTRSSVPNEREPSVQLGEPGRRRRERLDAEHPAIGVDRGGDMSVEVGVNPASDQTRLYDGHRHPFSVQVVKGWHARPGKETVTIGLRQQADRSPSGTGRAHVCADARSTGISTCSMPPISQTGTVEPPTVATHNNQWWTPSRGHLNTHWHLRGRDRLRSPRSITEGFAARARVVVIGYPTPHGGGRARG